MKTNHAKRAHSAIWILLPAIMLPSGLSFGQVAGPANVPASPTSQPTADDIQTAIDAKLYSAAVKTASKLLSQHGPAAAGQDRFQLTMLKGYAQAGLRSMNGAVVSFKAAQKETLDPGQVALAKWTAMLFQTAGSVTFVPKTTGAPAGIVVKRGPFDLLNPQQRRQAFGALLDDNLSMIQPRLKQATVSQKLPEIMPVLQQVLDLDQLDIIANGNDDRTQTLAGSLLDHSRNLLANALKADWARVSDIDSHANNTSTSQQVAFINNTEVTQTVTKKNGLSDNNRTELQNIITICQKIHDAAESFMSLAKTDSGWTTIVSDADRVAGRSSDVLSADYGTAVSSSTSETYTNGINSYPTNLGQSVQVPTSPVPASGNSNPNPPVKKPTSPAPGKPVKQPGSN